MENAAVSRIWNANLRDYIEKDLSYLLVLILLTELSVLVIAINVKKTAVYTHC